MFIEHKTSSYSLVAGPIVAFWTTEAGSIDHYLQKLFII